jgi:hypothetical protein
MDGRADRVDRCGEPGGDGIDPEMAGRMSMPPRRFPFTTSGPAVDPREASLDDTIESSFPASDPPSSIPDPSFAECRDASAAATASWTPDRVVRAIEAQAAKLPSDPFLWAAVGAIGASAALHVAGRRHAGLFVGQWAPVLLLLGVYSAIITPLGPERDDRLL